MRAEERERERKREERRKNEIEKKRGKERLIVNDENVD
jgi:hypothetical protein